jgi:ribonuclease D
MKDWWEKLCNEGFGDLEILKNKLSILSQLFDLQAFGSSLGTPSTHSLAINVDEKLFWLDDGSKIYV